MTRAFHFFLDNVIGAGYYSTMKRTCMRCGCSLGPDVPDPDGWDAERYGEAVSHGLCPDCLARELARYDVTDPDPEGTSGPAIW